MLMTVKTDGELVGGCWDVGERRNLKAVGSGYISDRTVVVNVFFNNRSSTWLASTCGFLRHLVWIVSLTFLKVVGHFS